MSEKSFFKTNLKTEITYLKGVGPNRGSKLKKHGIENISDILYHFPRRYIDRSNILKINKLRIGEKGLIVGRVASFKIKFTKKGRFFELDVRDPSGSIKCIWFHGLKWITEKFEIGEPIAIYGKIEFYNGFRIIHPEFDLLDESEDPINTGKIISIYPSTSELKNVGIDSRGFRRIISSAIESVENLMPDFYSDNIRKKYKLINLSKALKNIHQPKNLELLDSAIKRLKFDEHFFLQLIMALKKANLKKNKTRKFNSDDSYVAKVYKNITFKLTSSQIKVLKEIRNDLSSDKPMNRLIQGDVGCGKTIVAILASAMAIDNSAQVAIMAPTEILSEQHYNSFKSLCEKIGISCELLTGEIKKKEKEDILNRLKSGEINIIVGTHALIQDNINFNNLGLAIIDEQHRFGVAHRKALIKKATDTNVLAMTATPIPRTLSMTVHGDMDISIIDELPGDRIPIITKVSNDEKMNSIYSFLKKQIKKNRQCYIVYPIIEESEKLDLEAANTAYKKIRTEVFPEFNIGYIHGKLKKRDRDKQMESFVEGKINILVSTTVIEVGIDNPNATVMLIENAERFGLTQLHQLRGRIGRGKHQSYCILIQRKQTDLSNYRLKVMENTSNGFKISDEDLKLRGPGEFFGKRQHGYMKMKIGDISEDNELIDISRKLAFKLVDNDHDLRTTENQKIKEELLNKYNNMLEFIDIG